MNPKRNSPKEITVEKHSELIGKKFGKLTVQTLDSYKLKTSKNKNNFEPIYTCVCDCGNTISVSRREFKYGNTQSCGCLREENYKRFSNARNISDLEFYCIQLYKRYKASAERRKKEFNLTLQEFSTLIEDDCTYCGRSPYTFLKFVLPTKYSTTETLFYNGIDRKDNNIGYITDNCVTCCKECNKLKGTFIDTEFLNLVERIHKNVALNSNV